MATAQESGRTVCHMAKHQATHVLTGLADAQRTSDLDHKPNTAKEAEQGPLTSAETQEIAADGGAQDKSEDTNEEKPAEVSDSQEGDITNDAHDAFDRAIADSKAKPEEEEKHPNDEGDHVVEGEEDTVIY